MSFSGILLAGGRSSRFDFNKLKVKIDSVPLPIDQIFKLSFFCDEIIISTSRRYYSIISSELNKIDKYKQKYNFKKIQVLSSNKDSKNLFKETAVPLNIKIILDEDSYRDLNIKNFSNITGPTGRFKPGNMEAGSIIGIYSGLTNAAHFYSLIIANDMPFISYNLLMSLAYESGAGIGADIDKTNRDKLSAATNYSEKKDAYIIKSEKGFEVLCGLYSKNCIDILKENIKKQEYRISDIFNRLDTEIISGEKLKSLKIDNLNFFNINRMQDYHQFKNIWQNNKFAAGEGASFIEVWSSFFFR